jgi:hypothetical protein
MKKIFTYGIVILVFSTIAFQTVPDQKKLKLEYTQSQWAIKIQTLQNVQEIMRKSTYPANIVDRLQDSVQVLINEISAQVGPQIKDTTAQKKK